MRHSDTISDLFDAAIAAEEAAAFFYKGLFRIFSHVGPVGLFWKEMMMDEVMHARELQDIKKTLTGEQLNSPAKQALIDRARAELKRFSGKFNIPSIKTLDDAYEIAYELEYSEVNKVFLAILSEFVSDDTREKFVLDMVNMHVSRLDAFSKTISDPDSRKKIFALHQ